MSDDIRSPTLYWHGADWLIGGDGVPQSRQSDEPAFPASDTRPPDELLAAGEGPGPNSDNSWTGGQYVDGGALTFDDSIPAMPSASPTFECGDSVTMCDETGIVADEKHDQGAGMPDGPKDKDGRTINRHDQDSASANRKPAPTPGEPTTGSKPVTEEP